MQATDGTYTLASVYTAPHGWENLAITADSNPELTHTLLLGYGVVNWVTKGVFLGERKIYMTAQPDDVLIPDELWDPATKTPNDNTPGRSNPSAGGTLALTTQPGCLADGLSSGNPKMAAFRLEMPFNGVGYNTTDTQYPEPGGNDRLAVA